MKTLAIALSVWFLAAWVNAGDAPVLLQLDAAKHTKAPDGSATAGRGWVQFSVQATNTSTHPIWLHGYALTSPFYNLFTRQKNAAWTDYRMGYCGTGAGPRQLDPGATTKFTVSIPEKYVGQQLRVEISIHDAPQDSKPITVSSDPALIQ